METAPQVLIVDDEPAIRALVAKIVQLAGLTVDTAADGAEGIRKLESGVYSVVVLDLMMPNVDGYALIDYLKARDGEKPAIIVISAGDSAALRQLDGTAVQSIVRKPFDIEVLRDLITAAALEKVEDQPQTGNGGIVLELC